MLAFSTAIVRAWDSIRNKNIRIEIWSGLTKFLDRKKKRFWLEMVPGCSLATDLGEIISPWIEI